MNVSTISYSPEFHNCLLAFMQKVYPNRDVRYLEWWLSNIDHCGKACWDKCVMVLDDDNIIGCTTVNELEIFNNSEVKQLYVQANTILLKNYRGKGLSRLIYDKYNYPEWVTFGFTETAWKIQPRYVVDFTPINPINVYISFSLRGFLKKHICRLFCRKTFGGFSFPSYLKINNDEKIVLCEDIDDLSIPANGRWTDDVIEIVRDKSFFQKRYYNIYRHNLYRIYKYISNNTTIGFLVLRESEYKGLIIVSLVDFRFKGREHETKALEASVKVARMCGIGLVITLTSRKWGHRLSPLTIKTKKKLHCAVGTRNDIDVLNDMLITSADSDLDFVYYK